MAAGEHQRIDAPCPLLRYYGVPGQRIAAGGGEEQAGLGKLGAGHGERAVMEIDAEDMFDGMIELAERTHEIGEREIAEACRLLRFGDLRVDGDRIVIGKVTHETNDLADRLAWRMSGKHEIADGNGAGIDERIARLAFLVLEPGRSN